MSEQMKINVGVIFGGRSVEHEVSIISAHQAIAAMNAEDVYKRQGDGCSGVVGSVGAAGDK